MMRRLLTGILVLTLACVAAVGAEVVDLNFGWQFRYGDMTPAESVAAPDSCWSMVDLPHDFQIHQPWVEPSSGERPDLSDQTANVASRLSARGFKEPGIGWYRRAFTPDSAWRSRRVTVDFGGIMLTGDVYLNGERIGGTDYGYLGFECDLSGLLKYDGPNVLTVRADTGRPDNSRWYTGGGLYRGVSLRVTDAGQYFTRHPLAVSTPTVSPALSAVVVDAEIATKFRCDSIAVEVTVSDPRGRCVYSRRRCHWSHPRQKVREFRLDSIPLRDVELWDCDHPALYTLTATLFRPDGTVADVAATRFGIRSVEFSPEFGMKLNGRKTLLKGIANHHTLGALGAAAYPRAIEKRLRLLKEFGFNHVRTSHNPYSEEFLDLCDEYGILVVDELYDKWTRKHSGGRTPWTERWQHDIPEWVRRDRNHPSVVMWSLGNELQLITDLPFNDWGVTPYRLQKSLLERYDGSRPVTVAMHPRGRDELTDSLPAPLALVTDIASYNYRYMYFPGDSRRFPWMTFYQSEANTVNMGPNFFGMDLDRVVGLAYWGMIDYLGESQGWPAKGWTQGVFDISLRPKPLAYFLRSFFKPDEPLVRVAPVCAGSGTRRWNGIETGGLTYADSWNFHPGDTLSVYTFTNASEVELLLNGRPLGRRANDTADPTARNRLLWDNIVYEPGVIEARAYDGTGRLTASHSLHTAKEAVRLVACGDNERWLADGLDLMHVEVLALDAEGNIDASASFPVEFSVEGPADIVGVINGDMNSHELMDARIRSLYRGAACVILRSRRTPGAVTLRIASPLTPGSETALHLFTRGIAVL